MGIHRRGERQAEAHSVGGVDEGRRRGGARQGAAPARADAKVSEYKSARLSATSGRTGRSLTAAVPVLSRALWARRRPLWACPASLGESSGSSTPRLDPCTENPAEGALTSPRNS